MQETAPTLGFIGLGVIGAPMCCNVATKEADSVADVVAASNGWTSPPAPWTYPKASATPPLPGQDLKTAFITLSGYGRLVAVDWPRPGLPLAY